MIRKRSAIPRKILQISIVSHYVVMSLAMCLICMRFKPKMKAYLWIQLHTV